MGSDLATAAEAFRRLHHRPEPLVLPNAWDAASARIVEAAGFPAVATTSGGVAQALGYEDNQGTPPDEMFAAVARIARAVSVPVTADLEAGYGLSTTELVARIVDAGVVGLNYEDTDHDGGAGLVDTNRQAERVAGIVEAARAAGVPLVVNARVDVFLHDGTVDEALERGRAYLAAGADCVYPIGVIDDEDTITALVRGTEGPVNVFARWGVLPVPRLADLGVRRISFGSGITRTAMTATRERVEAIRDEMA